MRTLPAAWFTYEFDGSALWLSATAAKGEEGVYTGTLYSTTGPAFNARPFDPNRLTYTPVGRLTITRRWQHGGVWHDTLA